MREARTRDPVLYATWRMPHKSLAHCRAPRCLSPCVSQKESLLILHASARQITVQAPHGNSDALEKCRRGTLKFLQILKGFPTDCVGRTRHIVHVHPLCTTVLLTCCRRDMKAHPSSGMGLFSFDECNGAKNHRKSDNHRNLRRSLACCGLRRQSRLRCQ